MDEEFEELREQIEQLSVQLLELLCARGQLTQRIGALKDRLGRPHFDPVRESEMLQRLLARNTGPFADAVIAHLFKEIFKASADMMGRSTRRSLQVHRVPEGADAVIDVQGVQVGGGARCLIAGPCAVESEEQLDRVAAALRAKGVRLLRGGAFKPRTSPYSFQGLGDEGLRILRDVARRHDMRTVTEVVDARAVAAVCENADVLQIGARNMQNFELLRAVGHVDKPVLLKRGLMATMEELILAAEYIAMEGNKQLILCERGIRTFETWTRNTLDISAVPILKREVPFPIVVDLSHSTGRKDIVVPLARCAFAAGADAVMLEVHPNPLVALSDADQQLSLAEFEAFHAAIADCL